MIYPYNCTSCGLEFHLVLAVRDYEELRDEVYCPVCKTGRVKRIFFSDGISIQFKGDGFTKSVKEEIHDQK